MSRTHGRILGLAVLVLTALIPCRVQAGVFKALLEKMDKAMNDYNNNMWVGDASVGKTVLNGLKGKGGGFNKTFDATAAALMKAQDQALADVKEVLKAVSDIIFWLPKKLNAAFNKLMDGVRHFMDKLGKMNQGATVKERWKNIVAASGGAGGGAPAAQAMGLQDSAPEPDPAPASGPSGGDSGAISGDALADLLGKEDSTSNASISVDEIMAEYGQDSDAPQAPGGEEPGPESFGKMVDITYAIPSKDQQTEARKRIRVLYLVSLDTALGSGSLPEAAELIKNGAKLYQGNADGMRKAMEAVAKRHPDHQQVVSRAALRMSNLAKTAGH